MTDPTLKKQVKDAINFRTAVRVYNDDKIPQDLLDIILDSAWQSPSSIGLEGWRFLVLENENLKKQLKEVAWGAQYQLETASHFILLLAEKNAWYDSQSVKDSLIRRGITDDNGFEQRLKTYKSFQLSDLAIHEGDDRALFDWTAKQTYIALGDMMITAAFLGIDSCPIEGFDYHAVNTILAENNIIDPKKEGVASMLSLGYRLRDPKHPKSRKPRESVITYIK
ncbi:hypothetical protein HMPREF9318_02120 [Streptococcus urinalis FB127-CNA-2]|uniref:Nitroreductase family protein n=1 Tax=Streptococcus urinalis 2285-97 TaxID=764291 RepID=G5KIE4_9STRE|nr:NAD(P)H-dependent oxidoreductase [Streptococcus urinalis]EHJ57761.1 nitroreductase family protein [Streptococcus urinalis 2285-97]EKS17243.1 hypothetical protein HMPREF9318_02120 [Streptococcus urinalis FB127-CNA-2]VEF32507.1 nitroreductase family protein [Streptococcus urinalis]